MTGREPSAVVRDVQTLFGAGAVGGLTDGQLLERFLARRDAAAEAAFAALVQRHGPMVWGVCRRIVNDPHAAADAFQATFLVLVRKAATVRVDDSLGRWLYGVSRRVARRARIVNDRRSAREGRGIETLAGPDPDPDPDHSELLVRLDEEIGRLPERYRSALVLCDLGEMTHEEAARHLGCAVGTVGSRLARGRERLRERLTRRGLVPSASVLGAVVAARTASAAVPAALVDSTTRAALQVAAGEAASVAANVLALSKGTLNAMLWTRLKVVAALASLAGAGGIALSHGLASEPKLPPVASRDEAPTGRPVEAAEQILARMATTYADARSYEDEGVVTIVFTDGDGRRRTDKRPFSTKFVRPKLFRYEYSTRAGEGEEERDRYVIWSDAAPLRARSWWTIQPEIKEVSLGLAVGTANGVSGGSSLTVPSFLMPGLGGGSPFTGLHDFREVREEAVDGAPCHTIEGKNIADEPETIWIDKATYLVKKMLLKSQIPGSAVETTTTYRPRLNVELSPDRFTFVPPAVPRAPFDDQPAAPPLAIPGPRRIGVPGRPVPPPAPPAAPAAAPGDVERRLAEVERKLERILRILEGGTRSRPAPGRPADPDEPRPPAPAPAPPLPPPDAPKPPAP